MAFDDAPNTWIDSWSEDGTTISVPIASFPELTAAEADGTTGDIRKVLFALCDKLADEWDSKAEADRPAKMIIQRSSALDSSGNIVYTFYLTFTTTPGTIEVAAE